MLEVLKYGSIISIPLFGIILIFLLKDTDGYTLKNQTISRAILFLSKSKNKTIFRLNFLIKGLLDLGFAIFVINRLNIQIIPASLILLSALIFSSLGYFTEAKSHSKHELATYTSGLFWLVGYFLIVQNIHDLLFTKATALIFSGVTLLTFGSMLQKRTNAFIQIICGSAMYLWMLYFIINYL